MHFAILIANPAEPLNIALAGSAHFSLQRHGLAFWLKTENGKFAHVSDTHTHELMEARPFTWYMVDCLYRIESGTYDLDLREENQTAPAVSLRGQKSASGGGGWLDRYSFVSDPYERKSNVVYYVDDIVLAADTPVEQVRLAAPGRRKLFIDYWNDYRRQMAAQPGCLPASGLADFGVFAGNFEELKKSGSLSLLERATRGERVTGTSDLVKAARAWRRGCEAAAHGEEALAFFEAAAALAPSARLYAVARLFALASLHRWREVETVWYKLAPEWRSDTRYPLIEATLGLARGDFGSAEQWLQAPAELSREVAYPLWCGRVDPQLAGGKAVHDRLMADEYYFVLLWQQKWALAAGYAAAMAGRLEALELPASEWRERAGDAWFFASDYSRARSLYEESLARYPESGVAKLRLSDVWFRLGNLEQERVYREAVYGSSR